LEITATQKMKLPKRRDNALSLFVRLGISSIKQYCHRFLWLMLFSLPVWAAGDGMQPVNTARGTHLIVLDAGHTPQQGGALGARGIYEVAYNDHFTAELAQALQTKGYKVALTRKPEESIGLNERAAFANRANADLFLSIHHDSAQLHYLHKTTVNGKTAYQTIKPIRGYSLFVSQKNPQFRKSLLFAEQIGSQLSFTSNRKPTLHHAEKIAGENRELLDAKLGIYRFDDLVVLAKTKIPAVLLEVGVIVDADDEAYVNNPQHQKTMINAISNAVDLYFLNSGV
jgi:N-acetylmuramoyl-L-alanine amidase